MNKIKMIFHSFEELSFVKKKKKEKQQTQAVKILRTKRALKVKQKVWFMIFKEIPVAKKLFQT